MNIKKIRVQVRKNTTGNNRGDWDKYVTALLTDITGEPRKVLELIKKAQIKTVTLELPIFQKWNG